MPFSANFKANIFDRGQNSGSRQANWMNAQPAFFLTLSIPIKLGRAFEDSDALRPLDHCLLNIRPVRHRRRCRLRANPPHASRRSGRCAA
jgi:hypothetical protein